MSLPGYAMNQRTFPEMYEQCLVRQLFRPWAEIALDEVNLAKGDRLLDIACGTGIVARIARERFGDPASIVGVDLSRDMLAVAKKTAPEIEWREGSALALPLREGELFDVIVCQQGLQFFPDKPTAASQLRRAAAPGGRVAVSTWRSDDEIPFFRELRRIAERHLGEIADQRHSFGDAAVLEKLLRDAGFHDVRSRVISRIMRFNPDTWLLRGNAMALMGMSVAGKALDEPEKFRVVDSIVRESECVRERYSDGSKLAFELSTNLATARG